MTLTNEEKFASIFNNTVGPELFAKFHDGDVLKLTVAKNEQLDVEYHEVLKVETHLPKHILTETMFPLSQPVPIFDFASNHFSDC